MGVVYRGRHPVLQRGVAIKVPALSAVDTVGQRFLREEPAGGVTAGPTKISVSSARAGRPVSRTVAAPTAGLHFTPELLGALSAKGVRRADMCLHVGVGTFKPVEVDDPSEHVMHEESYSVSAEAAAAVNSTRARGSHVWAVGTTSLRTLETLTQPDGSLAAGDGSTRIFIHPPQMVRGADRLITNFHLPRSTLLMLVAAMAGTELTLEAYRTAVRERYRFYSYGDAMVIL